jgi:hypothetical protein
MLDGNWMRQVDGTPATTYPPGFSIILAITFAASNIIPPASLNMLNLFILISMSSSALLLFSIGRTLYPPQFSLLAVLLWLTYPIALWTTKQPNSEVAFLPFFLAAVAVFWRTVGREEIFSGRFFVVGILIGLAMLIRPAAIGLGILFVFLLAIWRHQQGFRRWLFPGGFILLGNLIVIFPWLFWLQQQTGHIALLSTNGPSSIRDGLTFAVNLKGYRNPMIIQSDVQQVMQSFLAQAPTLDSLGEVVRAIWSALIASPLALIKLILWKAVRSWYATDSHRLERPLLLIQLIYLVFITLGAAVAWSRKGISRKATQMILLITLYFWAMTILVLSIVRYMMPVMALLMLFIPFVLVKIPPLITPRKETRNRV